MAGITKITKNSIQGIDTSADATAITIDSSENVGIGTSSPQQLFEIENLTGNAQLNITADELSQSILALGDENNQYVQHIVSDHTDNSLRFHTAAAQGTNERMRIDSSGKVLVGKTASGDTVGAEIWPVGYIALKRAGVNLNLNRQTSDGSIANFQKDSVDAGSIGVLNSELFIGSVAGSNSYLNFGSNRIIPATSSGGNRDNVIDLGNAASRFDDIYATNGTIQTSDQNEKQSIQSLTASEIAVAQRISKLFKTFKFNSAVEEKGDSARTHTGIIAQDVQQAFADEGLDASNYALFISSTWWEKEISVDAVAEELDEEGNILVEGKDAYTYIDTKEEATEGYTEKTRLGIRYPELLSFVSSAFEQRLTNIETRLTALENI